jgi:hypothetical protein
MLQKIILFFIFAIISFTNCSVNQDKSQLPYSFERIHLDSNLVFVVEKYFSQYQSTEHTLSSFDSLGVIELFLTSINSSETKLFISLMGSRSSLIQRTPSIISRFKNRPVFIYTSLESKIQYKQDYIEFLFNFCGYYLDDDFSFIETNNSDIVRMPMNINPGLWYVEIIDNKVMQCRPSTDEERALFFKTYFK